VYGFKMPGLPAGTLLRYYVEARAPREVGTTVFFPARPELDARSYLMVAPVRDGGAVRIASVARGVPGGPADPRGKPGDRIRLQNTSKEDVDLSGMFLSDHREKPRKWGFPPGTVIVAGGYLVVWADGEGGNRDGLHAGFKLAPGEEVILVDADDRGNAILSHATLAGAPGGK
jgi:hypothetical protein